MVARIVLCFFLHRAFALVVVLGFVALHRVSIRTLDELYSCKLGAGWGERRVDAAIYRSASKAEVGSQSEHGVVATGEHVDLSSS
ncbi:hypothetical protein ACPOL_6238 [Acidisarcina polymorpha]|uniref:Uncharacterized protein n=1 Tax=Acidisarcina polymorpha TaxID=2211140 RepID=A0A2Z5G908_9BACT|nr:hypothetical protein ACPOL_6238 [Acidisarcina polymorpha]